MSAHFLARSFARTALFAAGILLSASPLVTLAAPADDAPIEVENAQNSHPGIVNANATYVRCGPAESYYPTLKLDKGTRVTVVGMKLDWLKIVPPEGSFCYISKAFVDRNGDGTSGKVNKDAVNVRAGSVLNSLKVVPLCQLTVGQDVKIVGEQDEYYKIAPPEGKAFVFINKQFVDPDPNAVSEPIPPKKDATQKGAEPFAGPRPGPRDNGGNEITLKDPSTRPSTTQPVEAVGPTTRPAEDVALIEALFDKAEAEFNASNAKPLDQQPIAELTRTYETIVESQKLPSTLHKIAETRVATLKARGEAAGELAKARAAQEEMRKRQVALQAERKELEDKLKESGVASYTAVGELQSSSMQLGSKMLYRLTDPANGRTVCYIRTDDTKIVSYMGKFIGVKGDLSTEQQLSLKVVAATEFAPVDPAKVNKGVSANVIPPSMLGSDATTAAQLEQRP